MPKRTAYQAKLDLVTRVMKRAKSTMKRANPRNRLFVKSGTGPELKNMDVVVQNNNLSSINSLVLLNGILAGTGPNAMIGRRCTLKSFQLKYSINPISQVDSNLNGFIGEAVRVLVVYDRAPEGTTPGITDIIVQNTAQMAPLSPMNLTNSDRFTVIMDKLHALGPYNILSGSVTYTSTTGIVNIVDSLYKKLNLPFEGPSSSGTIGGINCGAIYMLALGSNTIPCFTISYNSRIRFVDL